MKLVSLEEVKARLGITEGDTDDILDGLIDATSADVQTFLNRTLETGTHTEYFNGGNDSVWLKSTPVTSITSVKESVDTPRNFSGTTALSSDYYEFDASTGHLLKTTGDFTGGKRAVQVIYVGGYADLDDGTVGVPDAIRQATLDQVVYYYKNRNLVGRTAQTVGDGTVSVGEDWGLLRGIRAILRRYRRRPIAFSS